jgi:hypothetical protein
MDHHQSCAPHTEFKSDSGFTGRIGAHPQDIIDALRTFTRLGRRRAYDRLYKRRDRRINRKYYRERNKHCASKYNEMYRTRAARRARSEAKAAR